MSSLDNLIATMGLFFIIGVLSILALTSLGDAGCYVVGKEVNGDYSTEYLALGNCH